MQIRKLLLLPVTCGLALAVACGGEETETSRIDVTTTPEQEGTTGTTTTTTTTDPDDATAGMTGAQDLLLQIQSPSDAQTTERRLAEAAESQGMRILERIDLRETLAMASQGGASGVDGASPGAGTTGMPGTTGAMGTDGTTGAAGTDGTTGAAGTNGTTGAAGTNGTAGTTQPGVEGTAGTTQPGADGTTGTAATPGTAGTTGTPGTAGTTGTPGATGSTGAMGTPGMTAGAQGTPATYDPASTPRSATLFLLQDPELSSQLLTQTRSYAAALPIEVMVVENQQGLTTVVYDNPEALTQAMDLSATDPMGMQLQRAIEDIVQRATSGETAGIP